MVERHHRRSIRLPGYDYARAGAYFFTICTYQRECLLGEIRDGTLVLTPYGELVEAHWRGLRTFFPRVELDAFVVMPNHVHGIVMIEDAPVNGADVRLGRGGHAPDAQEGRGVRLGRGEAPSAGRSRDRPADGASPLPHAQGGAERADVLREPGGEGAGLVGRDVT